MISIKAKAHFLVPEFISNKRTEIKVKQFSHVPILLSLQDINNLLLSLFLE